MKAARKKVSRLIWPAILVAVIGIASVSYLMIRTKNNNPQTAVNTDSGVAQPMDQSPIEERETATGTIIKVGNSQFGPMLFDNRGQAIYIWQLEDSSTAECYGDCAEEWPPVLTDGAPVASAGVNNQLLGTTERTDGTTQVTYNGHPLYYYAHEAAGEVECHNIRTHGGLWWVIQPNGDRAK
jgi:predicted lipoprotein with Yx(FWY)xxD motif